MIANRKDIMKKIDDENKTNHSNVSTKKSHNNNEIRVLSSDDEKIKVVGEVLANESSKWHRKSICRFH